MVFGFGKKEKEEFFLYAVVDIVINIVSSTLKNYDIKKAEPNGSAFLEFGGDGGS